MLHPLRASTLLLTAVTFAGSVRGEEVNRFDRDVRPILEQKCFGCHADGGEEGSFSFDKLFATEDEHERNEQWHRVVKQLRADLMPPPEEEQPSDEEVAAVLGWIKSDAFGIDPDHPDPGRVTVRRLNRVEYRNTIRDLLGVDFEATETFPADDTGHGFDNIGDVLSISPLLLEKYVDAANEIISDAVPMTSRVVRRQTFAGNDFKDSAEDEPGRPQSGGERSGSKRFSYYENASARLLMPVDIAGDYTVSLQLQAQETYVDGEFDQNRCELIFRIAGEEVLKETFVRQGYKKYTFDFPKRFEPGEVELTVEVKPLSSEPQIRSLRLALEAIQLDGPHDPAHYVKPDDYERFFPREVPADALQRREYARELLSEFAGRAFRRPADAEVVDRLVDLAMAMEATGETFEAGVAAAMTAVIASPRFIFREEFPVAGSPEEYPLIDEYSLASRLSYLLWSSMPDAELMQLAADGQLRANLDSQIERLLADKRSSALQENFVGQWLQSRAVEGIPISARAILQREAAADPDADRRRQRFGELRAIENRTPEQQAEFDEILKQFRESFGRFRRFELSGEVRRGMKAETEAVFKYILDENRSLLELIDADYTFLNEPLAKFYEMEGIGEIEGDQLRRVELPEDSLRGGLLTQGTFLVVTSNPDRTSPVKRGLYILENLLGTPTGAPPPDIPPLDEGDGRDSEKLSLRETLELHRESAVCSSCHNRMDPLGLAFENFNALGRFREKEFDQPIDASGQLVTGEAFDDVRELKRILVTTRRGDLYRCMAEKMLTYALGRGVEYYDVETVERVAQQLEADGGKAKTLLKAVIASDAFQRTRRSPGEDVAADSH